MKRFMICLIVAAGIVLTSGSSHAVELLRFPLDAMSGVIDREVASMDDGALHIQSDEPLVVKLFEVGDLNLENCRLVYSARVRGQSVSGRAFLEMWLTFPDKGRFFSRGLNQPVEGDMDWRRISTVFLLQKGENPEAVELNLVLDGDGEVWIDDLRLHVLPLK